MTREEQAALVRVMEIEAELLGLRDLLAHHRNPAAVGINRASMQLLEVLAMVEEHPEWGGPTLRLVKREDA